MFILIYLCKNVIIWHVFKNLVIRISRFLLMKIGLQILVKKTLEIDKV